MFVTGLGKDRVRSTGIETTRDAAKAAVTRSYHDLCAADPDNRAYAHAHHEQMRRSADLWQRSKALPPVDDRAARDVLSWRRPCQPAPSRRS